MSEFDGPTVLSALSGTAQEGRSTARHRWFAVKESFSPSLVNEAFRVAHCGPGDLVLDPFCGAGTVTTLAAAAGFPAVGIEVNPFLAFIAMTKLSSVDPEELMKVAERMRPFLHAGAKSHLEDFSTFSRRSEGRPGLFNLEVLRAFEAGWIEACRQPPALGELAKIALLGAASENANFKRDGKALRYIPRFINAKYNNESMAASFAQRITEIACDLKCDPLPEARVRVIERDSRRFLSRVARLPFKLCITSPPYLNSFDYTDIYRPELFLGQFVRDMAGLRSLRKRTVRSHVQANWSPPVTDDFGETYRDCALTLAARRSDLWDQRIPTMVQAYFEDMKGVLSRLKALSRADAVVWMVVSTSAYAGVEIPVDKIICDIAVDLGWRSPQIVILRNLRSSGQHWRTISQAKASESSAPLRESVVMLSR